MDRNNPESRDEEMTMKNLILLRKERIADRGRPFSNRDILSQGRTNEKENSSGVAFASTIFLLVFGLTALASLPVSESLSIDTFQTRPTLEKLFSRDTITIAVTDSGLGGLSIMAEAAARLKTARSFKQVDLVFFNALFSNDSGYNSLPTREAKIKVFDGALRSLAAEIKPDLILVGCNTLSVLIADVPFVKTSKIPIIGIIDSGVAHLIDALSRNPDAAGILFGTETTIAEGEHRRKLLANGIAASRLASQPCPELASYIETDWRGDDTGLLISSYVDEAVAKLSDPHAPVYAALVCTHFGYSTELWERAFAERGMKLAGILNPNTKLIDVLDQPGIKGRFSQTQIRARVISMVEIAEAKRASLGARLEPISPETARALNAYALKLDLFEWKPLNK